MDSLWYGAVTAVSVVFFQPVTSEVVRCPRWANPTLLRYAKFSYTPARLALFSIGAALTCSHTLAAAMSWRAAFLVALLVADLHHYNTYKGHAAFVFLYTSTAMVLPRGPMRMGVLRLVVAHQLGSPAIYKLLVGGVAWVHPDTMNESMTAELPWQKTTGGAFNRFSLKVDWLVNFMTDHPALELLSGTVALLFEFSAIPVCLFGDSDLLFVFMFMCSVFHLSIVPLTGVVFPYHLLCYAPLMLDYTVIAPSPDCFHNIPSLLACALLCASSAVGLEDWPINAIAVFPYNGQQIRLLKRHMGIFRFSHSGANKQTTDTCVAETCCCKCAVSYDPDFIAQFDLDEHPTKLVQMTHHKQQA